MLDNNKNPPPYYQIVEGPLSKWTNMVQGWQCRWFVLDQNLGLLSYYTSKQKMKLGVRRGCIRLLQANLGLDDEDQNIFTITDLSNDKTFHFQTKDSDERNFWLKHLEESIQIHLSNKNGNVYLDLKKKNEIIRPDFAGYAKQKRITSNLNEQSTSKSENDGPSDSQSYQDVVFSSLDTSKEFENCNETVVTNSNQNNMSNQTCKNNQKKLNANSPQVFHENFNKASCTSISDSNIYLSDVMTNLKNREHTLTYANFLNERKITSPCPSGLSGVSSLNMQEKVNQLLENKKFLKNQTEINLLINLIKESIDSGEFSQQDLESLDVNNILEDCKGSNDELLKVNTELLAEIEKNSTLHVDAQTPSLTTYNSNKSESTRPISNSLSDQGTRKYTHINNHITTHNKFSQGDYQSSMSISRSNSTKSDEQNYISLYSDSMSLIDDQKSSLRMKAATISGNSGDFSHSVHQINYAAENSGRETDEKNQGSITPIQRTTQIRSQINTGVGDDTPLYSFSSGDESKSEESSEDIFFDAETGVTPDNSQRSKSGLVRTDENSRANSRITISSKEIYQQKREEIVRELASDSDITEKGSREVSPVLLNCPSVSKNTFIEDQTQSLDQNNNKLELVDMNSPGFFMDEYDSDEDEDLDMGKHKNMISFLIGQVRIGMDLTRISLPTFILEHRSLLEMYASFFSHPDIFLSISDFQTPKDRMLACLRWYISSFHAGRKSSIAKKPYNPILGEVFECVFDPEEFSQRPQQNACTKSSITKEPLPSAASSSTEGGSIPWAKQNSVQFIAEQVSHHPPISAFYAENLEKKMQFNGQIWTKSKFLGLSICVHNIGQGCLSLLAGPGQGEEYIVNFPTGYGRSILSVPWVELGGECSISCEQTGYSCTIDFQTKPFYGGKTHKIVGNMYPPHNKRKSIYTIEGEWNGVLETTNKSDSENFFNFSNVNNCAGEKTFIDTTKTPIHRPFVRNLNLCKDNESRKLWKNVSYALRNNLVDLATDEKLKLEAKQRADKADRERNKLDWETKLFERREDDIWVFKNGLVNRMKKL